MFFLVTTQDPMLIGEPSRQKLRRSPDSPFLRPLLLKMEDELTIQLRVGPLRWVHLLLRPIT